MQRNTIFLNELGSDEYTLSIPIKILIKKHGKKFIAIWEDAEIFGAGETRTEAINDLKYMIGLIYERLEILPIKTSLTRYIKRL